MVAEEVTTVLKSIPKNHAQYRDWRLGNCWTVSTLTRQPEFAIAYLIHLLPYTLRESNPSTHPDASGEQRPNLRSLGSVSCVLQLSSPRVLLSARLLTMFCEYLPISMTNATWKFPVHVLRPRSLETPILEHAVDNYFESETSIHRD